MSGAAQDKTVAILDLFAEPHLHWTPEEMMAALGYSRPTLYRYLKTLRTAGFLSADSGGVHTLGPRVVEMDYLSRRSDPLIAAAEPALLALAGHHPATALVVRWYGDKLLCIASKCSTKTPRSSYPRGRPMPLARGAISRAILSHLDRRQMMARIDHHLGELRRLGLGETQADIAQSLRAVRRHGTAVAFGEVTPGVVGIAAPIFGHGRTPAGVLCLTAGEETLDDKTIDSLRRRLKAEAAGVSARLASPTGDTDRRDDPCSRSTCSTTSGRSPSTRP